MAVPWILHAKHSGQSWEQCVDGYPTAIQEYIRQHGALLIRGLQNPSPHRLEEFVAGALGELMSYSDRTTPRRVIEGKVYSSTDTLKRSNFRLGTCVRSTRKCSIKTMR